MSHLEILYKELKNEWLVGSSLPYVKSDLKERGIRVGRNRLYYVVGTYKGHISQLDLLRKVPHQPAKEKGRSGLTILRNEPVND